MHNKFCNGSTNSEPPNYLFWFFVILAFDILKGKFARLWYVTRKLLRMIFEQKVVKWLSPSFGSNFFWLLLFISGSQIKHLLNGAQLMVIVSSALMDLPFRFGYCIHLVENYIFTIFNVLNFSTESEIAGYLFLRPSLQ